MNFFKRFKSVSLSSLQLQELAAMTGGVAVLVALAVFISGPATSPEAQTASLYYANLKNPSSIPVFNNGVFSGEGQNDIFDIDYLDTYGMYRAQPADGTNARPAPPACMVNADKWTTCTYSTASLPTQMRTFGVASLYETANTNVGFTKYFKAKSNGDRYNTIWSAPTGGITGSEFAQTSRNFTWDWIGTRYFTHWEETNNRQGGNVANVPDSFNDSWTTTQYVLPASASSITVAAGSQLTLEWSCQDYQIEYFYDTYGVFGAWTDWVFHYIHLFDQGIVKAGSTQLSTSRTGSLSTTQTALKPYASQTYTMQCNALQRSGAISRPGACIATQEVYDSCSTDSDCSSSCDQNSGQCTTPTTECTQYAPDTIVNWTIPTKLAPALSFQADVVNTGSPLINTSISAISPVAIGTGSTITWQADYVYSCTLSGQGLTTTTLYGSNCNGSHSAPTTNYASTGTYTYTLSYVTYNTAGTPTTATKTANVIVNAGGISSADLVGNSDADDDITLIQGGSVPFTWTSGNVASCAITKSAGAPSLTPNNTTSGSASVSFPSVGDYTYTFTCTGASGYSDPIPDVVTVHAASNTCNISHGTGTQTWNGTALVCTWASCDAGYERSGNTCVLTSTEACTIPNGDGLRTREATANYIIQIQARNVDGDVTPWVSN